ncbi:stereocilin [Antennarius striatus]|uniref:stereocilin n=1 Tax=Antennarius striatus TaxID=241820 RepID=UPI0035B28F9F
MSGETEDARSFDTSFTGQGFDIHSYYETLSNLSTIFEVLMRESYMQDLPRILVCILSGRQDCGLEAELTKTVSLELVKPLLTFVSSLRSKTCTPPNNDGESSSFLRAYFRMGDSSTASPNGFQHSVMDALSSLPLSATVMNTLGDFVEAAVTYVSKFMAALLQVPLDYLKIALQFGIRIPSLDEKETCEQGDLKQLIMWGLNNNVSWSFGNSITNILLDSLLATERSPCTNPGMGCQNPLDDSLQRSARDDGLNNHDVLLKCDRRNLARFNDTMCAAILVGSSEGYSTSVLTLCEALKSLNSDQLEMVWSNMCHVIQALLSVIPVQSPECYLDMAIPPFSEMPSLSHSSSAPHRAIREAPNLQQLVCDYDSWLESTPVDAGHVTVCSDNEREEFVKRVCNDALLMKSLLSDEKNLWLYGYCVDSPADHDYMLSQFCVYDQWLLEHSEPVGPALLEFCLKLDGPKLDRLICEHTAFFVLLFSIPENLQFMPNCTDIPLQPPGSNMDPILLSPCRYSEWHDLTQITIDVLSECIRLDYGGFNQQVCANRTFLNSLLLIQGNAWLEDHCNTSLSPLFTEPTPVFNIAGWCDYIKWEEGNVDVTVVGLCWQHDQLAFQKNVCCKASVLNKLLEDPQNKWLSTVCTEKIEEITVVPQMCRYSDWTRPIIVDMTELALCAEIDPLNFTTKVCANRTILENLLANQDNTWLMHHCANQSGTGVSPGGGGGQGGGLVWFNPSEQCQYSTWIISPPDPALLTLCWEHDQATFVSSICPSTNHLLVLSQEPSSEWVVSMCDTYTNYTTTTTPTATTTTNNTTNNNNGTTTEPNVCPARNLVRQFNWTCSEDLTPACQSGASQNIALQMVIRCWVESLGSRVENLLTYPVATVIEQVFSTTVVILLALEEVENTSLYVTNSIRLRVLASVVRYLQGENNFAKKRVLLQCFGSALTSLMQTGSNMTNDELSIIKEYFSIPLSSLRSVLSSNHVPTVRLILQYYSRNHDQLKLSAMYLSTMVSVVLQTHVLKDPNLLTEMAPMLTAATTSDISALPSVQNNINVRETINSNLLNMSLDQRWAFGLWFSQVMPASAIVSGQQSIIRDTGNLIAYLPFYNFQHLSPAQLLDGLDVLQRNILASLKQEFIAHSIIGTYRNLTAQQFTRLGNLSCLADPEDLLMYKGTEVFGVIQDIVMNCTRDKLSLPSHLISSLFLDSTEFEVPSLLPPGRLSELAPLLPSLGVLFLQDLTPSQLFDILPALLSVTFSPAQAFTIVEKILSVEKLTTPGQLQELGQLVVGVKTEDLLALTSDKLLPSLPAMAQHTPGLSPPQANAVATKLWGFKEVVGWLVKVEPLLYCTPLLSVLPRTRLLVNSFDTPSTLPWNTQQAIAIFKEVLDANPNLSTLDFLNLGTVGQGVSCKVLQRLFRDDSAPSSVRRILQFLREQPGPLHTSLKKCVIEELYQLDFYELLEDVGAEIALSMPVSTIKKFPVDVMDTFRMMIIENPKFFFWQPRTKQKLLVDKIVQRKGMYTGQFTEEEFLSLGFLASYVVDEVFIQVDRRFFVNNLNFLRGLCYCSNKILLVAHILQEPVVFGPVNSWNQTTLSQVDRLLFFLPVDKLQEIPMALMTVGRIEKLFMSQQQWELGDMGIRCLDEGERRTLFERQQFVLQFFLGFLKINPLSPTPMVPTCEILHTTLPSAWTSASLTSMSPSAFSNCMELIGHDLYLASYQRIMVLQKVKEIYGTVSSFSQSVIAQLGGIALAMSAEELRSLRLTKRRSIAAMGAVSEWSKSQLEALFSAVLNSTKQSPSQLDSSILVAMGNIVCGADVEEMNLFNAVEFSKAVLWLGQLHLTCSEKQLEVLVRLLTHPLTFGLTSSWGTDVFIEIGVLAAGLPDIDMSSLVKAQIAGFAPEAFPLIPSDKFKAVFDQTQIGMFSYEQAAAVTKKQLDVLSPLQKRALDMVLTPWEDRPVDFRAGKSLGLALSHSPLCLMLGLLILLIVLSCPCT